MSMFVVECLQLYFYKGEDIDIVKNNNILLFWVIASVQYCGTL